MPNKPDQQLLDELADTLDVPQREPAIIEQPGLTRELTPTERVGDDLTKSLTDGAKALVKEAQEILTDDEKFCQQLRKEIRERVDRHARFMEKMHKLRESNNAAKKEFNEQK